MRGVSCLTAAARSTTGAVVASQEAVREAAARLRSWCARARATRSNRRRSLPSTSRARAWPACSAVTAANSPRPNLRICRLLYIMDIIERDIFSPPRVLASPKLTGGLADVNVGQALWHRTLLRGVLDRDVEDPQEVADAALAILAPYLGP